MGAAGGNRAYHPAAYRAFHGADGAFYGGNGAFHGADSASHGVYGAFYGTDSTSHGASHGTGYRADGAFHRSI